MSSSELEAKRQQIDALNEKYAELGKGAGAVHAGGSDVLTSAGTAASIAAAPGFNPVADAKVLFEAMKGLGTKKAPMVEVLSSKSVGERLAIRKAYEASDGPSGGKDLFKAIESEWQIGGNFERILKVLIRDPYERDANFLNKAMKGLRTDSSLIVEVLCTQEASELRKIADAYAIMCPGHVLLADVEKEYSGVGKSETKALFSNLLGPGRPPSGPIDLEMVMADANALREAGEDKTISNQQVFATIFSTRSYGHIVAMIDAYPTVTKKKKKHKAWSMEKAVTKKTSGTLKKAIRAICSVAQDPTNYWCERLHEALQGQLVGSDDKSLIRTIVSRAEVDLMTIEALYASKYGKPLQADIGSGKMYLQSLLKIVEGNQGPSMGGGDSEA